jgi:WD40 repeat protein
MSGTRLQARLLFAGLIFLASASRLTGVITDPARQSTLQTGPADDFWQPVRQQAESPAPPKAPRTDRYGDPLPEGAIQRLGTVRFRHSHWIPSIAFSPDGKMIASGSSDHTIRLWDRATGREIRRFTAHRDKVSFVFFTPDGKHLISASGRTAEIKDASIRLWEVITGQEIRRFPEDPSGEPMGAVALSADGKTLAMGVRDSVGLVDVPSGRSVGRFQMPSGNVTCVRFTPDSKSLAAVFEFVGAVCLFDLKANRSVWQNKEQATDYLFQSVEFAPDGRTLAVCTTHKAPMRLLDVSNGKEIRRFQGEHNPLAPLAFSSDGKRIFSNGWGKSGIIWDVATGKPIGGLDPPLSGGRALVLSPDGKTLAGGGEGAVRFWDVVSGKGLPALDGSNAMITSLSLSPDGKKVLAASHFDPAAGIRIWDLASGLQAAMLTHRSAVAVYAPDGKTFAAGCFEGAPVIGDSASGRIVRTCQGEPNWIDSLASSPDGKLLVGTGWISEVINVWDASTGKELSPIGTVPKSGGPKCLALSPDGRILATGGMDRIIRLWDVGARKEIRQLVGQEGTIWALAFSPDGKIVAGVTAKGNNQFHANGTDRAIRIWNVQSGQVLRTIEGPTDGSWSVAWSADGRVLATGGEDGLIRFWEAITGQERVQLAGHEGPVSALAFTKDGKRLISGGSDSTALVWDLERLARPSGTPAVKQLPDLWAELAGNDAAKAYRAMKAMTAVPDQTLILLKQKLHPAALPDLSRIRQLVSQLDDEDFAIREKAFNELEILGELAAPALRDALAKKPSLELQRRAGRLVEELNGVPASQLPGIRAVEVMEMIATPQAREILKILAHGAPQARLTREAKASLDRLAKRTGHGP